MSSNEVDPEDEFIKNHEKEATTGIMIEDKQPYYLSVLFGI